MKKRKFQLKEIEEYYSSASQKLDGGDDYDSIRYFNKNCQQVIKSYILWLEETRINEISNHQIIEIAIEFDTAPNDGSICSAVIQCRTFFSRPSD